jgi:hypothetical protein
VLRKGGQFPSIVGACSVTLLTNPMMIHEWGKSECVNTTKGTYSCSFVTHIFCTGWLSHGGNR